MDMVKPSSASLQRKASQKFIGSPPIPESKYKTCSSTNENIQLDNEHSILINGVALIIFFYMCKRITIFPEKIFLFRLHYLISTE